MKSLFLLEASTPRKHLSDLSSFLLVTYPRRRNLIRPFQFGSMDVSQKGQSIKVQFSAIVDSIWFNQRHKDHSFFREDKIVSDIVTHLL